MSRQRKTISREEFDEFKENTSELLESLKKAIADKITTDELQAKQALECIIEAENTATSARDSISEQSHEVKTIYEEVKENIQLIQELLHNASNKKASLEESFIDLEEKTTAFKRKIESLKNELSAGNEDFLTQEEESINERINSIFEDLKNEEQELRHKTDEAKNIINSINIHKSEIEEFLQEIPDHQEEIQNALTAAAKVSENFECSKEAHEDSISANENIKSLLSHSMRRKSDIDELHRIILGHTVKNEDGEIEHIDGLKTELENSYFELETKKLALEGDIKEITDEIKSAHLEALRLEKENFEKLLIQSKERFNVTSSELESLLPGAMAAGLSEAYSEKKISEEKAQQEHKDLFEKTIYILIAISSIPVLIDLYLLFFTEKSITEVIQDTPKIILAILPLYFPALWMAHSANKRMNLSKRLIEEYTHKLVLGKTFSGLSKQIETLPHETAVKDELRVRMLFNILEVSSENPGKLITDYQKSDHPLMEALENSAKLSKSIEQLTKFPGLAPLVKNLSKKNDEILKEQNRKVEDGLKINEDLKKPAEEKS